VPASSLNELISLPSAFTNGVPNTPAVEQMGLWVGEGQEGGQQFQIRAYLESSNAQTDGSGLTVRYVKQYWTSTGSLMYSMGQGSFTMTTVGSVAVLEYTLPESLAMYTDEDSRNVFLFAETDTGLAQTVVRRGDKSMVNQQETELLFNAVAKDQILAAFAPQAALPAEFVSASGNGVNFSADATITLTSNFGVASSGIMREWGTSTHAVTDYYAFDASGNGGRWVRQEWDLSDIQTTNIDEAMTWLVDLDGNLEVTVTSSGSVHQVALNSFNDSLRPDLLVLVDNVYDGALDGSAQSPANPERLVTQVQYKADLSAKVDLVDLNTIAGNYHYSWNVNQQLHLINDGTFDEYFDNAGTPALESSGTWTVDATNDFFTLDWCSGCGDEDLVALESIAADTGDIDGDSDTTENVYTFTGWWLLDSTTGLGSMYRDQLLIIQ